MKCLLKTLMDYQQLELLQEIYERKAIEDAIILQKQNDLYFPQMDEEKQDPIPLKTPQKTS